MFVKPLVGLVSAAMMLGAGLVPAQTPTSKAGKTDNAALKYFQAFIVMPRHDDAWKKVMDDWRTVPIDAAARKVIEDSKDCLYLLHCGARLPRCDWGLNLEDRADLLMPHLSKARELAQLCLLRARAHFERGKLREGVEDVAATVTLGRQTGVDSAIIALLVQNAIEQVSLELAARYLPTLGPEGSKILAARWESLPVGGTFRKTVLIEKEYLLGGALKQIKEGTFGVGDPLEAVVRAAGGPKGPIKQMEEFAAYYDELYLLAALPRTEFLEKTAVLNKKWASNPFAKLIIPAFDKAYEADFRTLIKRGMFKAALAIVQNGADAVKTIPDPGGSGPFEYQAVEGGFELRSQLKHGGAPVIMKVGQGKSK